MRSGHLFVAMIMVACATGCGAAVEGDPTGESESAQQAGKNKDAGSDAANDTGHTDSAPDSGQTADSAPAADSGAANACPPEVPVAGTPCSGISGICGYWSSSSSIFASCDGGVWGVTVGGGTPPPGA